MDADFSKAFHQSSKNRAKGHPPIPENLEDWPEDWKSCSYKIYPRFPKIQLQDVKPQADFFDLILKRSSGHEYDKQPISLREISTLLQYSCGVTHLANNGMFRRAQPSAGGLFPIEVYLLVISGDDLPSGLYHYNVQNHQLDILWSRTLDYEFIKGLFPSDWVRNASSIVILTAVFGRSQIKYGERGYRYILLEAGHIGQNIYLNAEALNLQCCALGFTEDTKIDSLLEIDGVTESIVYAIAIGK